MRKERTLKIQYVYWYNLFTCATPT